MIEKLESLLNELKDWEKRETNIHGVKIMKIPETKSLPSRLGIEINPVDEDGKPLKRKGAIILTNEDLFKKYKEIFDSDKVIELIEAIDELRSEIPIVNEKNSEKETFEL